jgi:spoIIIJ-associated protein
VSEGERGLLGVGTTPARVIARAELGAEAPAAPEASDESATAALVRESVERIADALGARARVVVTEDREGIRASATVPASEAGFLIGRNGRTIDAVNYVVSSIAHRMQGDGGKSIDVDAGGYRARRHERLAAVAHRAAERAISSGSAVTLAPMTAVERRIVHTELQDVDGVETQSEGDDPARRVVVIPV